MSCHYSAFIPLLFAIMHNLTQLFTKHMLHDIAVLVLIGSYWRWIDRWSRRATRWVSPDGWDVKSTLSPHFHSPVFLLSLSSIPLIQVPLYNSCPGAAPAFFGTGLERKKKRQMFNFHFLCASLYICLWAFGPLLPLNADCGVPVVQLKQWLTAGCVCQMLCFGSERRLLPLCGCKEAFIRRWFKNCKYIQFCCVSSLHVDRNQMIFQTSSWE